MVEIPKTVIGGAQTTQAKWGIPASISIAQWALESAWGRSMSGKNNPFGIKALPGMASRSVMTWEVLRGKHVRMKQNFADFDSIAQAFDLHGKLLATSKYYINARKVLPDADKFADALTGVYATDPAYGKKLKQIMKANDLYQYNKAAI